MLKETVLQVSFLACGAVLSGQVHVTNVVAGSRGASAGLQKGDVLREWRHGGDQKGQLSGSPFEFDLVEVEQGTGPADIVLSGTRGGQEMQWTLQIAASPRPWGITVAPVLPQAELDAYFEGARAFQNGSFPDAAAVWERAADSGVTAVWLLSLAGNAFSKARLWPDCDRVLSRALTSGNPSAQARLAIHRLQAETYLQRSQWEQAKSHHDQALALAKQLNLPMTRSAVLYDLGRSYIERAQPQAALPYLQECLAIRERQAPESPLLIATLNAMGRVYNGLRQLNEAEKYYERAFQLGDRLIPETAIHAATISNLGSVAMNRGNFERGKTLLTQAWELSRKLEPGSLLTATTAASLAVLYKNAGDLENAMQLQIEALDIRRKLQPNSLLVAASLNDMANIHRMQGDLNQAETEFREALAINERLAPMTERVAGTYMNLAGIAQTRHDWKLATDYYRRAFAIWDKIAPDTVNWAGTLVNLSQVTAADGNVPQAEEYYQQALRAPKWQKTSPLSGAGLMRLMGEIYAHKKQYEKSRAEYLRALEILEKIVPGSDDAADTTLAVAEIERRLEHWEPAEAYYQKALAILARISPGSSPMAECLGGLAAVALHNKQPDKAEQFYKEAVEALEEQLRKLGGSEVSGANFRSSYMPIYHDLIDLQVSQKKFADAFHTLERSRAQSLLASLAQRNLKIGGLSKELDQAIRANSTAYDRVQSEISKLSPETHQAEITRQDQQLRRLSAERAHLIQQVRMASPGYASLRYPEPHSLEEARKSLEPGTAMISYLVEAKRILIFTALPIGEGPDLPPIPVAITEDTLRDKVNQFRKAIEAKGNKAALAVPATHLYEKLILPVEARIQNSKRVVLVPDGPLHVLPFAALMRPTGNKQYLIDWKPLRSTISATLYSELKNRKLGPYQLDIAVFANPMYALNKSLPIAGAPDLLLPLANSEREGKAILEIFGPRRAQGRFGKDATEEAAKAIGSGVRILHFSVHGLFDEKSPLNSALVFTTPSSLPKSRENGVLQTWELYEGGSRPWNAELVVLSACNSGLGKEVDGEGLMGMTRAIHYAGAQAVVSSLWEVDDTQTPLLMKVFYQNLHSGRPKAEALREALVATMKSPAGAPPFYWATFNLYGY